MEEERVVSSSTRMTADGSGSGGFRVGLLHPREREKRREFRCQFRLREREGGYEFVGFRFGDC